MANKDTLIKMFEGIRDERTKHANTARRIGNAFLSMLDFASSAGDGKLSSVHDDIAQGFITFVKGLMSNQLAQLKGGASFGSDGSYSFDKDGNLVIESAQSRDFDEMLQNGFALKRNPTSGKCTLSISDLIVWGRMVINTLEIRKKYAIGGNVYLSGASSKIQHVEKVYSEDGETVVGYKCYILKDDGTMATQNNWVVGDQALCQTFDIEEGVYQNVSNQYYWRLVTQVSEENVAITEKYTDKDGNEQIRELYEGQKFAWVVLSKDDCDTNSGIPASGDTIVLDGHRLTENEDTDYTERTNVLMLEATGSGSPRIIALTGVVDYKHTTDNEVFILSPQKVIFTTEHFEIRTASGAPITFVHFMGPWVKGTEYHYYDQVSHANALWTCIVEKGKSTTDEPTDGSTYWRKEMSGGKGEKGDDAVSYSVSLMKSLRIIAGHSDQSAITVSFRKQEGSKITTSGKISDFGDSASVKCYIDGEYNKDMTNWINSGNDYFDYLNYKDAWAGKSVITVVMYIGSDNIVASANFSLGQSGEGVVMAYKNDASQPSKPTVEDLSQLSGGWSRTPQKGGSYNKVSNISYGNYSVDNTTSGYSTSEWSEVSDSGETWRKSPSGLSDIYGWAIMKVSFSTNVDNLDVKAIIKAYSEANFDFIQVHELDTEITGSNDLRKKGVAYISGNGIETSYSYHVATAGQHFFYVSYCKDSSGNSNGDYGLFRFDLSDNLVSIPSTVWMSQAVLKDGKAVLPWSTPVQITGDDAYRVEVSPSTLVFDTNENGVVDGSALSGKYATVTVYKGSQKISADNLSLPSNYATKKYTNVDGKISNVNGEARITIDRIEKETISGDEKVSKSSGQISFPIDVFGERSTLMWVTVNVQVNVSKFTGSVAFDNKGYKAQFDELSKNAATKDELKDVTSTFEQTARKISLSVSEKSIARRNLLVGSAFQRDDNNVEINEARIEMNTGYQGTNCIRISDDTTDGKTRYPGAFWDGSQGGKSVRITKGKKYVISCWYKTNDANGHLSLETLYTDKQTNAERKGAPKYLSAGILVPKPNQWQLFTTAIDTTDAEYDYIAFNFYEYCSVESGLIEAYICRPMVEEGDTYGGWTLSQDDYDIIGANLIDNSRTLDVGGNILTVIGKKTLVGDVYELTASGSDDYNQFYRIKGDAFKLNTDYTLSFEVRGDAKYLEVNAFYPANNTKYTCYIEQQNNVMYEKADDGTTVAYVILGQFEVLSKQQKVWVHFRFKDRLPEQIYFQFKSNAEQTGVTSWSVTITKPKIEVGAVVTEYTERKSDLVDKASLKAAGIEITSDQVILYGNKVQVKNPKANPSEGYDEAAMFQNGKLNAQFINAGEVVAEGINAKEITATKLNVTGDSKIGIWHITKVDGWGDVMQAEGTEYNGATVVSGIQYCPLFVRGGSLNTAYFRVGTSCTEFSYMSTLKCFNAVWSGMAARTVCKGSANDMDLPTNYFYSTQYEPVQYIYSEQSKKDSPAFAINVIANGFSGTPTAIQTNGAIRGVLAPNAISINGTQQIPNNVGAVICTNSSDMTLTLPASPVEGQTLIIIQGSTSKVYIVPPKGDTIYWGGQTRYDTGNRFYSGTIGQFTILVFIRGAWQLQFMNNRP